MEKQFTLSVTAPSTPPFLLLNDIPDGISIDAPPAIGRRGFEVEVASNIDIQITLDLTKTAAVVFSYWLARELAKSPIDLNARINRKALPPNERDAVEVITREIEKKD